MITPRSAPGIARRVEEWFGANARDLPWRERYDPYHVWVSEFMAQQTRMEVVLEYFPRFIARFPTIEKLAAATEENVVALWSGLGYYRRARMLHKSAREIVDRFDGALPSDAATLITLHGFGPYTAGAVSSIAFDKRAPLVDGNVARLVARLEKIEAPWRSRELEKRAWEVAQILVDSSNSPRALNQGLMELGARVCRPKKPDCGACPLSKQCGARRDAVMSHYPRPAPKKKTIDLEIPVFLFPDRRGRLLFKRAEGPLMNGMLLLPLGNDALFADPIVVDEPGKEISSFAHTITNRRVRFRLFAPATHDSITESSGEWTWISPEKLAEHPHPSWVRKAIELWRHSDERDD